VYSRLKEYRKTAHGLLTVGGIHPNRIRTADLFIILRLCGYSILLNAISKRIRGSHLLLQLILKVLERHPYFCVDISEPLGGVFRFFDQPSLRSMS